MFRRAHLIVYLGLMIIFTAQFGASAHAYRTDGSIIHVEHFSAFTPDTDVQLYWPLNNSYSTSVDLKVISSPMNNTSIFWGHMFSFMNSQQGYLGFGIGGNVKVATVAIFGALNGTTDNPTGGCEIGVPFSKSGVGWQCFILYDWSLGNDYTLTLSKQDVDDAGNTWWQASILDHSVNSTTVIGSILAPPYYGMLGSISSTWNEYSTATTCNVVDTDAIFSSPYQLNTAGNHAPSQALLTYGNATCTDSNVEYLDGGAYETFAGINVNRTTPKNTYLWTQEPSTVSEVPEFPNTGSTGLLILTIWLPSLVTCGIFSRITRRRG